MYMFLCLFFFNDTTTTEIYTYLHTLSLHDALPISGVLVEALAEAVLGIAGDEDHLQIRAGLAHLAHQARPVEARHHHVGDQQVDRRLLARQYLQRGLAGVGLQHVVALVAQRPRSEEHTSELQSLMRISYAVFCLK